MPAYFSVEFQINKSDLKESIVDDFIGDLSKCGMVFKSGFWNSENDSLEEISKWNTDKLLSNFKLGYTEHYSHDYKQYQFKFYDFKEARVYIINYDEYLSFYLIIPEDDFVEYSKIGKEYKEKRFYEKMQLVEELALNMWKQGYIYSIQTVWECSDGAIAPKELKKGYQPSIEPFAIVKKEVYRSKWDCRAVEIERGGVILLNDENWLYL